MPTVEADSGRSVSISPPRSRTSTNVNVREPTKVGAWHHNNVMSGKCWRHGALKHKRNAARMDVWNWWVSDDLRNASESNTAVKMGIGHAMMPKRTCSTTSNASTT